MSHAGSVSEAIVLDGLVCVHHSQANTVVDNMVSGLVNYLTKSKKLEIIRLLESIAPWCTWQFCLKEVRVLFDRVQSSCGNFLPCLSCTGHTCSHLCCHGQGLNGP